jgi:hypothetical protein
MAETYLYRTRKHGSRCHVWIGADTACRMWSTGGLKHSLPDWAKASTMPPGREVCSMCASVAHQQEQQGPTKSSEDFQKAGAFMSTG